MYYIYNQKKIFEVCELFVCQKNIMQAIMHKKFFLKSYKKRKQNHKIIAYIHHRFVVIKTIKAAILENRCKI